MKIFAIIVTYNGVKWLDKCLGSLFNSTIPISIVLIDNKSTDDTVLFVNENFPAIHLIAPSENLGFGKANNIGIKHALENDADYVFLLNQDAWVEKDTIEELIKIHDNNRNFGIISPIHLNGKGTAMDYNFSQACNAVSCPDFISDVYLNKAKDIYEITFVMAAIWLVPKDVLLKAGLFDPIFPHYGEDVDYVQRVISFGYKIGICPHYVGFHDRENRKPSDERSRVMRYLGYICILKNNNQKFSKAFLQFTIIWGRNIFMLISKSKFKFWALEIRDGIKILLMTRKIISNRKYCSNESAFL
jgi:GT2 family glycosyltransferase